MTFIFIVLAGLTLGTFLVVFLSYRDGKIATWENKIREIHNSDLTPAEKRRELLRTLK